MYTKDEINKIKKLAIHADLENALLALELIRARGIISELITEFYWIYNRLLWEGNVELAIETKAIFQNFVKDKEETIYPIFSTEVSLQWSLHPQFEMQAEQLDLNLKLIASLVHEKKMMKDASVFRFIFRHGTEKMQANVLVFLLKKESTGGLTLDIGGMGLRKIPQAVLRENKLTKLFLWGNKLDELPEIGLYLKELEMLNVAENKLTSLPDSFVKLEKLEKLYAQNNCFEVLNFSNVIKKMPNIKHLGVADDMLHLKNYSISQNEKMICLEALVNQQKIHLSLKEQLVFLGLDLNNSEAIKELSLLDLFEVLSDENEERRRRAKELIISSKGNAYNGTIPSNAYLSIVGIVSFSTHKRIDELKAKGIKVSMEIETETTHIVLGDFPGNDKRIGNNKFVFMSEDDL